MSNVELAKSFKAEGAIPAFTIVKVGAADGGLLAAAAATDKLIGVSTDIAAATGERCDAILSGVADVLYGGNVARGDLLSADASGRAIVAAASAGSNVRTIGFALVSAVVGDVGQAFIAQGSFQG